MRARLATAASVLVLASGFVFARGPVLRAVSGQAQSPAVMAERTKQAVDQDYTKRILDQTPDKRILTELVDHMPMAADPKVPSPLKFFGYIPGENGKLTYHADVVRYLDALQKATPRVKMWNIGKTEEGREMVAVAISDEATIKNLQHYKDVTAQLTDPRKTSEAAAKQLIATGKPIYYASGSIHTPEPGSVEMLMELAYRLAIEESPFIQTIRSNEIVVLTPASEVDGREKLVDGQRQSEAVAKNPSTPLGCGGNVCLAYWGHYVQHDNNRDGIGVGLALTNNMLKSFLDLHPTVFHDLHESEPLLYVSTGTGPYNPIVAPIQVTEWWWLAQNEIMEMTKRGVPGVWTYDYYDGWIPNYMFWIGVTHNSIGRFYETQSYGQAGGGRGGGGGRAAGAPPANAAAGAAAGAAAAGRGGRGGAGAGGGDITPGQGPQGVGRQTGQGGQEKEWYRVDPIPPEGVTWSSRENVNMQESALLISLNTVATNREKFLENYYTKNKQMIEQGKTRAPHAYIVPAKQRRAVEAADLMNMLRKEGVEVSVASQAFQIGQTLVTPGDYIVRMDQPYGGVVETLMGAQWYPPDNPRPYDDTGWDIPVLRNIKSVRVDDAAIFDKPMTVATADFKIAGTITGTGSTIVIDHTADNPEITFAYQNKDLKLAVAEQAFDLGGHHFPAGAFVLANANRAAIEPLVKQYGLMAWATDTAPSVPTHPVSLPRIGYIHSWGSTQDEGWWRMALDKLKVPYDYFGENLVRMGGLRQKYDVILYPHTGGVDTTSEGVPVGDPVPYRKTAAAPNLGTSPDQSDDTRGGLGKDGLRELAKFVTDGGVLIAEGTPARIFPQNNITQGITLEQPTGLYVQGSVIKAMLADKTSPILYGLDQNAMGVLFNVGPLFGPGPAVNTPAPNANGAAPVRPGGGSLAPMGTPPHLTTLEGGAWVPPPNAIGIPTRAPGGGLGGAGGGGPGSGFGGGRGGRGGAPAASAPPTAADFGVTSTSAPRVVLAFPTDPNDLLLSGELTGGELMAGHPALIDEQVGKGHAVLFGFRPFWRFETQGNFFLVFNTLLNWDHLGVK